MHLKIKVERFPFHYILLGGILILFAIFDGFASQSYILNVALLLIGVLLVSSHQRLVIDLKNKKYSEFYWVMGLRISNYVDDYQKIISLVCSSTKYSQQYGKYNRRFISGIMYQGHIKLKDQESIYIGQNKSKKALLKKLNKLSAKLNVVIEDNC